MRFENGDVSCKLCSLGCEESMDHFLLECASLENIRVLNGMVGKSLEEVLLFTDSVCPDDAKTYLKAMWKEREKKLRMIE